MDSEFMERLAGSLHQFRAMAYEIDRAAALLRGVRYEGGQRRFARTGGGLNQHAPMRAQCVARTLH
jgi:hypothetical protein